MKKFFKRLGKVLCFAFLYLLTTVATAVGVIFLSPKDNNSPDRVTQVSSASQISSILDNLTSVPAINLNMNVDVETPAKNFNIEIVADLNLSDGIENISAEGEVVVNLPDSKIPINFNFSGGKIFLDVLGGKFVVKTDNLSSSISQIVDILGVEMPDIGIDLSGMNMNSLMSLFSNIKETANESGILLEINLPVVGNLQVYCDQDYNIQSIVLPATQFSNGTKIGINADLAYPEKAEVSTPNADEFIEANDLLDLAGAIIKFAKSETIALNVNLKASELELSGTLYADTINKTAKFETELLGEKLAVTLNDNTIYASFGNIFVKFNLADTSKLVEFLQENFNVNFPADSVMELLETAKDGETMNALLSLDSGSLDSIDLSFIEKFDRTESGYLLSIKNIGDIEIAVDDNGFKGIAFNSEKLSANITRTEFAKFSVDSTKNYVDISELLPAASAVLKTAKMTDFSGNIEAEIKGISAKILFKVSLSNSPRAHFDVLLNGEVLKLDYFDGKIFVSLKGACVVATKDELADLISRLTPETEISENDLTSALAEVLSCEVSPYLINDLKIDENGLSLTLLDKIKLAATYGSTIESVSVNTKNLSATINFTDFSAPEFDRIETEKFMPFAELSQKIDAILTYVQSNQYYLNIKVNFNDLQFTGKASFESGNLMLCGTLIFEGRTLGIKFVNNTIFAELENIKVSATIDDLHSLLVFLKDEFDIDLSEKLGAIQNIDFDNFDISSAFGSMSHDFDAAKILEILPALELNLSHNEIGAAYNNFSATLAFDEGNIKSLTITLDNLDASICVASKSEVAFELPQKSNYVALTDILETATSALSLLRQENIGINFSLNLNGLVLTGYAGINLKSKTLAIIANYSDISLKIIVTTEAAFVEVKNVYLKLELDDLSQVIAFINTEFGMNIDSATIEKVFGLFATENPLELVTNGSLSLESLDLSMISEFAKTANGFEIGLKNIGKFEILTQNGEISGLTASTENLSATAKIVEAISVELSQPEQNYSDIISVLPAAHAIINTAKCGFVRGSGNINFKDTSAIFDFAVSFENGLRAHANIEVMGQNINLELVDGKIYLSYKNINISVMASDIDGILDALAAFDIIIEKSDISDKLSDVFDSSIHPLLIQELITNPGELVLRTINNTQLTLKFMEKVSEIAVSLGGVNVNAVLIDGAQKPSFDSVDESKFVSGTSFAAKVKNVYEYVSAGNFYLSLSGNIPLDANSAPIKIDGYINYTSQNGLELSIFTCYNNIDIKINYINNVVYLDIANFKLMCSLSDIAEILAFVETEFEITLPEKVHEICNLLLGASDTIAELQNVDVLQILNKLELSLVGETLSATMDNISFDVIFDCDMIKTINLSALGAKISAKIEPFFHCIELDGDYFKINLVLPYITMIKTLIMSKQFDLTATASVFDQTKIYEANDLALKIDLTDVIKFYAKAVVKGISGTRADGFNLNLQASLTDDFMFFNYNGLALKMQNDGLENLLRSATNLLGFDENFMTELKHLMSNEPANINVILNSLLSKVNLSSDVSIINMIKGFAVSENELEIKLDGSSLSTNQHAEFMVVKIITDKTRITEIQLSNIYTGKTNDEHFNLSVKFNEWSGAVETPSDSNKYLDATGADKLASALINTLFENGKLKQTFEISGKITLKLKAFVIININKTIDVNIKIDLTSGSPEIFAVLDHIPVVQIGDKTSKGNLNNDTVFSSLNNDNRLLKIFYKNDMVYFYRKDISGDDYYEKALMAHKDTVLSDILYYLQWGTGLSPEIMNEIKASIESTSGHKPDLSKVITEFLTPDKTSNKHYKLTLDLGEITGNDKIDKIDIGFGLDETQEKVSALSFELNMPLASIATIYLNSDALSIVSGGSEMFHPKKIGQEEIEQPDLMQGLYDYVKDYADKKGKEGMEYDALNGDWDNGSKKYRTFTINFDTGFDDLTASSITDVYGASFELPTFENKTVQHFSGNTLLDSTTYKFIGWFDGDTLVENGIMPHYSTTYVARWQIIDARRTVTYQDKFNLETAKNMHSAYSQVGDLLVSMADLSEMFNLTSMFYENGEQIFVRTVLSADGNTLYYYKFIGWFEKDVDGNEYEITKVPDHNTEVVAKFEIYKTFNKHDINIFYGAGQYYEELASQKLTCSQFNAFEIDAESILPKLEIGSTQKVNANGVTITYSFDGWFLDTGFSQPFDLTSMPDETLNIYAKWTEIDRVKESKFVIVDGETVYEIVAPIGEKLTIPSDLKIDGNTQWFTKSLSEIDFSNDSYKNFMTSLPETMPEPSEGKDCTTIYVRNKYKFAITYFVNDNNSCKKMTPEIVEYYQGEALLYPAQENFEITKFNADGTKNALVGYIYNGYLDETGKPFTSSVMPNHDVSISSENTLQNLDDNTLAYVKIHFNTTWVRPNLLWPNESGEIGGIDDRYVLAGSTLNLTTLTEIVSVIKDENGNYKTNIDKNVKVSVTKHNVFDYSFESGAWNESGATVNHFRDSKNLNQNTIIFDTDKTVWAEWVLA